MTCPWIGPKSLRRCHLGSMHWHWPSWRHLAERGDRVGRMMLLVWWPRRRGVR